MADGRWGDVCNSPYVTRVTGISGKTLDAWVRRKKLFPIEAPRVRRTSLFYWSEIRPTLVELAPGVNSHLPVDEWPE